MPHLKHRFNMDQPLLSIVFLLMLLAACSNEKDQPSAKNYTAGGEKILECPRVRSAIIVDGEIEDAWTVAGKLLLDDPADVADPNDVIIYVMWDESYLYAGFDVSDKILAGFQTVRDHKALYKDDMIEVLIDPRQDRTDQWLEDDIVYHVNVLGQVKDDRGTPEGISDATWNSRALK